MAPQMRLKVGACPRRTQVETALTQGPPHAHATPTVLAAGRSRGHLGLRQAAEQLPAPRAAQLWPMLQEPLAGEQVLSAATWQGPVMLCLEGWVGPPLGPKRLPCWVGPETFATSRNSEVLGKSEVTQSASLDTEMRKIKPRAVQQVNKGKEPSPELPRAGSLKQPSKMFLEERSRGV